MCRGQGTGDRGQGVLGLRLSTITLSAVLQTLPLLRSHLHLLLQQLNKQGVPGLRQTARHVSITLCFLHLLLLAVEKDLLDLKLSLQ